MTTTDLSTNHSLPDTTQRATRNRTLLPRAIATAVLAFGLSVSAASPALAHDQLVGTGFQVNEGDGTLEALVLSYSNTVMDVGTEIVLTGPSGEDATGGAPEHNERDVIQPLASDLEPGAYEAVWRVVSSDGHPIDGALTFEIVEGASSPPEIVVVDPSAAGGEGQETASEDEAEHSHDHADEAHDQGDETHAETEEMADETESPGIWAPILIGAAAVAVIALTVALTVRRKNALESSSEAPGDGDDTGNAGSADAMRAQDDRS